MQSKHSLPALRFLDDSWGLNSRRFAWFLVDLSRFDLTERSVLNYGLTEEWFIQAG
jgi:hypothetical protein